MSLDILEVHKDTSNQSINSAASPSLNLVDTSARDNINETEDSLSNGILDAEQASCGLSNLSWSADGTCQVFLNLDLPKSQLRDISLLHSYIHLQTLNISHNDIEDLSPLGGMSMLLELDASHNRISRLLDFTPPKNLKIVVMSFNLISEIPDLTVYHYLQHLDLAYNNIQVINGLSNCRRLQYLSLKHNRIEKIEGLDNLPLQYLNLSCNQIKKIENLETLRALQTLELAANRIRTLEGLEHHYCLVSLDLEENQIIDMAEVRRISALTLLRKLNLRSNPVRDLPDYRTAVIFSIGQLTELDGLQIGIDEKVAAGNMFDPTPEYLAARDHMMHVVYSFLQPQRLLEITLPLMETPYPILVLVGPQGVGKKSLAQKLVEELPDYFGYAPSHTTRQPYVDEVPGKDYHFVSLEEFETGIKMGAFLQTCSYDAELYGLSLDAVEAVARETLACVVHMELEGVLTLKNTYLEPRYVLLLPLTRESHERRLIEKDVYSESQVNTIVNRTEMYAEYNRQHPGFFDATITCDDITVMYCQLRQLVLEYLGIAPAAAPVQEPSDLETSGTDLSLDAGQLGCTDNLEFVRQLRSRSAPATAEGTKRAWSIPSLVDVTVGSSARLKVTPNDALPVSRSTSAPRGIVEEESLKRRLSATKGTVAGASPTLYVRLLQQAPKGVVDLPASLDVSAANLAPTDKRWFSAPPAKTDDGRFWSSATAADAGSRHGSGAAPNGLEAAVEAAVAEDEARRQVPDTALDLRTPTTSRAESSSSTAGGPVTLLTPRPRSSRRSAEPPDSTSRPGSGRHAVLPPISTYQPAADAVAVGGS